MDDEYGSSENEQDELMEEAEDLEAENDAEEIEEEEEDQDEHDEPEQEQEQEQEQEPEMELDAEAEAEPASFDTSQAPAAEGQPTGQDVTAGASAAPPTPITASKWRPKLRQEYIDAPLYDIVPTMAAPQATSVNALAVTPDLRYWMTGGSDGYIRKYDGMGTINGKQQLTVAQRHPFVDSVVKAGILMSYWENEEPAPPSARAEDRILSPVYSLAIHSGALWLLSGLESGGINLQSVRHDEGKRIHCLRDGGHTNAVSILQLAPDEKSVLSGSWDKTVLDWDLNNGNVIRRFEGSGGQISAIELRPASGAPIPAEASEVEVRSETFFAEQKPRVNGFFANGATDGVGGTGQAAGTDTGAAAAAAGSPEHESLFGSPAGSLFGDNDTMGGGGGAFGDDDDEFSRAMDMGLHDEANHGLDHSGDFTMGEADTSNAPPIDMGASSATEEAQPPHNGAAVNLADSHGDVSHSDTMTADTAQDMAMDFSQGPTATEPAVEQPPSSAPQRQTQSPDVPPPVHANSNNNNSNNPSSPSMVFSSAAPAAHTDPTQSSSSTFLSTTIDGTIRIWDRRVPDPVARINNRRGVPPWCMGACWSPDGNWIYAGRRNGTVEEYSIHKATSGWHPERALKFPAGSGAVSCVRPMPNGRHLVCASHDILRLYDLRDTSAFKHSKVPFIIIPGPPRAGVISNLYVDPTSRIMISTAGTRGWDGTSTEVLIGYEIAVPK
ncbi:WD40 repeat-like protein [Parathielavia hyrcaniae]|uniref:WD40 repeat-like protein n=1 Tax=Parathielavia hyrcaniae TaxID=113614 RepID=A0AAN6PRG6_9PEZI|nr:WD40 repeat-like protein [Parathielavia hyrcaniae]